jgi:hypothetical protein
MMLRTSFGVVSAAIGGLVVAAGCEGRMTVDEGRPGVQLWQGNPEDCPDSVPADSSSCTLSEGSICAYWSPNPETRTEYRACACREASAGTLAWHCYEHAYGNTVDCPAVQPANGADCFGMKGMSCPYPPRWYCACPRGEGPTWTCTDGARRGLPGHPQEPSGTTPITELTDAQRLAWCEWYAFTDREPGTPLPSEQPVDSDGYVAVRGCRAGNGFPCDAHMPDLAVSQCAGNLALSSCQAPISELSDCVLTVTDGCWPHPHGCARYLEKPGCAGTIVLSGGGDSVSVGWDSDAGGSCSVRVQ